MSKTVIDYQNAFSKLINQLQKNKEVLAIFTYGSIVTGDIWEGSDIDLFVVLEKDYNKVRDVYGEVLGIPVHSKFLNKDMFMKIYKEEGKKGAIRKMLITSKLVFSKDKDITHLYDEAKYSTYSYRGNFNVLYLGKLIKDLGITKKYLINDGINTSYEILIRAMDSYSKLFLNMNGYEISKDALSLAMNLNDSFKDVALTLFNEGVCIKNIEKVIEYIEMFLDSNGVLACAGVLDILQESSEYLSSKEIMDHENFKDFNIKMESVLKYLATKGAVKVNNRKFKTGNAVLMNENVYGI
ncbi:MAG: nucleotidyltransferase domain-containing protein [Clostridium sp.]